MSETEAKPLRGAVIGAGYFSHFHYDAWNRIDGVEIVACCDQDEKKLAEVASKYGISKTYTHYGKMLDEVAVDFVDVITRPDVRLGIASEISNRGIDMICQKPLAPTFQEAVALVDQTKSVRMMVHENFRFQPWYRRIKKSIDQGDIGDQLHTITFRNRAGDGYGDDAYLARQPYFQTMEKFLLFEAGIHTIDTYRYLGGEIKRTWCMHRKLNHVIAGEDTALAIMDFEDSGVGVYDANRFNESTADDPRYTFGEVLVEGNGGTIRLYDDGRLSIQRLGQPEEQIQYEHVRRGFAGDCVHATQLHFVERLRDGQPFETSGEEYLKSITVQEAMYRSAETGLWQDCGANS
ncbi:MAG: Gfo/Idh/MocA family oxidoreductase [Planctomycetota bacterium]